MIILVRVSEAYNLLAKFPEIVEEIDFKLTQEAWGKDNKTYIKATCPQDCASVTPYSGRKAVFRCLKDKTHVWTAEIDHRTVGKTGCPKCAGVKPSEKHNLLSKYPKIAEEIDFEQTMQKWYENPQKYAHITCLQDCANITPHSGKRAIFRCSKDSSHGTWDSSIDHRTCSGRGCPKCSSNIASETNNLLVKYPEIAKEIDFEATLKAWEQNPKKYIYVTCLQDCANILPRSNKKAVFRCAKNRNHVWDAVINSRTSGNGCPKCGGIVASETNNLLIKYPEIANEIDFNATLEAWKQDSKKYAYIPSLEYCAKTAPHSKKRAIFRCAKDKTHGTWDSIISNRTYHKENCPKCAGQIASKTHNLLAEYPEIAKSIDFKQTMQKWRENPQKYINVSCLQDCDKILPGSEKRAIFRCVKSKNHCAWDSEISNRTNGCGCPTCASARSVSNEEKAFKNALVKLMRLKKSEYKANVKILPTFKENSDSKLELDFVCEKFNIAIEFNGEYWHSDKMVRQKSGVSADFYHNYKFEQAKRLGLTLLFVQEQDWLRNKDVLLQTVKDYCLNKPDKIPSILRIS